MGNMMNNLSVLGVEAKLWTTGDWQTWIFWEILRLRWLRFKTQGSPKMGPADCGSSPSLRERKFRWKPTELYIGHTQYIQWSITVLELKTSLVKTQKNIHSWLKYPICMYVYIYVYYYIYTYILQYVIVSSCVIEIFHSVWSVFRFEVHSVSHCFGTFFEMMKDTNDLTKNSLRTEWDKLLVVCNVQVSYTCTQLSVRKRMSVHIICVCIYIYCIYIYV